MYLGTPYSRVEVALTGLPSCDQGASGGVAHSNQRPSTYRCACSIMAIGYLVHIHRHLVLLYRLQGIDRISWLPYACTSGSMWLRSIEPDRPGLSTKYTAYHNRTTGGTAGNHTLTLQYQSQKTSEEAGHTSHSLLSSRLKCSYLTSTC